MAKAPLRTPDLRDLNGHPMSSWDLHIACCTCLKGVGQFCSRAIPCPVWEHWTDAMWRASEDAERRSATKREQRRRRREQRAGQSSPSLMLPPREVPKKLPKASSTRRWGRMRIGFQSSHTLPVPPTSRLRLQRNRRPVTGMRYSVFPGL